MSHTTSHKEKQKHIEPAVEKNIHEGHEPTPEHAETRTPSWFSRDIPTSAGGSLADRYRTARPESNLIMETPGPEAYEAYRRRLDEKFTQAQRIYDVPQEPAVAQRRPTLPLGDIHGRRRLYEQEQRVHIGQNASLQKSGVPWSRLAGLGTIAIVIGSVSGFGFANVDRISGFFHKSVNSAQLALASVTSVGNSEPAATKNETMIQKKTVSIAALDVNDVRGALNSMIPLMLSAQAADGADPVALKIMGVPQDAYLTAGVETTKGNWLLKPADIAGVKLVVPQSGAQQFNMEVAAVEEKTGALAAPIKAINVQLDGVTADAVPAVPLTLTGDGKSELAVANVAATIAPANAPPETAVIKLDEASAIPAASLEASDLISKGDGLLNSGDIASARQFYLRASAMGDAKGAYGVGRTYDPQVFAALNVQGLKPDPAKAADWYQKAVDGGVAAAKNALSGLQTAQP
jgi:hypothetical protein